MTARGTPPLAWIDESLAALDDASLLRERSDETGPQQVVLQVAGRELINFGSNDYLGLAGDARLAEASALAARDCGTGAGASPLVTGRGPLHRRLEQALAEFEGTEQALVFSSGYAANLGAISALAGRGDVIFTDEKNHASMIDGCRLSRAEVRIYPHADADALAHMLAESGDFRRRLIVTETIFSMDGDRAPLAELVGLAQQHHAMLLVDEAHAMGVFGARGRGLAEHLGLEHGVTIRIGTLSKALGSAGGFVAGSEALIRWLANKARPYVFSTAPPPPACAAALEALRIVHDEPERRQALLTRAQALAQQLRTQGWQLGASDSQIVPLVVGRPERAVALAAHLREAGLLVPAIRPPSVPQGESLLRISLTSQHTASMLERLCAALDACRDRDANGWTGNVVEIR